MQAHFAPDSKFNFHMYIKRSLEDDFKVVVGIRSSFLNPYNAMYICFCFLYTELTWFFTFCCSIPHMIFYFLFAVFHYGCLQLFFLLLNVYSKSLSLSLSLCEGRRHEYNTWGGGTNTILLTNAFNKTYTIQHSTVSFYVYCTSHPNKTNAFNKT